MNAGTDEYSAAADDRSDEALRNALRGPGLSAESLDRVRQSVTQEWQQIYGVSPARRRTSGTVRVAAVLVAAAVVTGTFLYSRTAPAPVVATVANGLSGSLQASSVAGSARSLPVGAPLRRGDQVQATGTGELRWLRGGIVRLRPGARLSVISDTDIRLTGGAIFVDLAAAHQAVALRILTPFATIEHVGTQFMVTVDDRALDVGVRQGAVRVIGANTSALSAGDALQLGVDGVAHQRRLADDDPAWHWTGEPLFAFDPEGRTVLDLLQWVSQEKGRALEFSNDAVRRQASATVLHGSVQGLTVDEAMELMLATTSLQAAVMDDRINVFTPAAAVTTLHR